MAQDRDQWRIVCKYVNKSWSSIESCKISALCNEAVAFKENLCSVEVAVV
jgi:hypothetical protein